MFEWLKRDILGNSPSTRLLRQTVRKAGAGWAPVCVTGETGTGKDLIARSLHGVLSESLGKKDIPFVPVNCASLPKDLAEAALFGHTKGAFTGAYESKPGLIQSAEGGCLLLDEIGDMPLQQQRLLLRFLDSGEIRPVGANVRRKVQVKVIACTNADLEDLIGAGAFRKDLFYRLNTIEIRTTPLRDRPEDIGPIAEDSGRRFELEIDPAAVDALQSHTWPGNVRELQNTIERAKFMLDGQPLTKDNVGSWLHIARPVRTEVGEVARRDVKGFCDDVQTALIIKALVLNDLSITDTAKQLGYCREQISYWLKKEGAVRPWMERYWATRRGRRMDPLWLPIVQDEDVNVK